MTLKGKVNKLDFIKILKFYSGKDLVQEDEKTSYKMRENIHKQHNHQSISS